MQQVYNLLLTQGVKLYLDEGKLKAQSLQKEIAKESVEIIKKNKSQLIEFLRIKESMGVQEELPYIEKVNLQEYKSSFAQQRLWFIDNLQSGSSEYNIPLVFKFKGIINLEALTKAVNTIVFRHEILRTVYRLNHGEVFQIVQPFSNVQCKPTIFDLTEFSESARTIEAEKVIADECSKQFNLAEDVMIRLSYLKLGDHEGKIIINMHHIASDGWSVKVLTREFCILYNAYYHGETEPLDQLSIQYIDYTHWLNKRLTKEVLDSKLKYWTEHLANAPTTHSIPLDYPRPEIKKKKGALVTGHVSSFIAGKLLGIAKKAKITPFMLLHAMLSLLIARHSNSNSIVMGTPTANRHHEDLESLIGFFVNTLVLKVEIEHSTVSDYLNHVRQIHIDAQSHQDVPFDRLLECLQVPRSASYTPLFQIMVTKSEDFPTRSQPISLHELELAPSNSGFIPAKFDLVVDFNINEQQIGIEWVYDCSLFSERHIAQLNAHLCRLLEALSESGEASALSQLDMLGEAETSRLLYTLNDTSQPEKTVSFVHQLFEQCVESNPDRPAVVLSDKCISYRQLNERANQLARYLTSHHGIKPNTFVGVCSQRTLEMAVAILAIFKAGGTYVPLDPRYPQARLDYMIKDSGLGLLFCPEQDVKEWSEYGIKCEPIDHLLNFNHSVAWAGYEKHNLNTYDMALSDEDLAYVIYTSGSTGKPKGVMIKHLSLTHSILHSTRCAPFNGGINAVLYHATSVAFDAAIWVFWSALTAGSKLRLAASLDFQQELQKYADVTHLFLTPSILECIEPNSYQSLKVVATGGESCSFDLVKKWQKQGADFYNCYGPTEITICSSVGRITSSEQVHIGRPNTNAQYFILDEQQRLKPFGAIGELYIGGKGLAHGYLNQPELTKERFIPNPYYDHAHPSSSNTLYRTGDLVNYLPDGNIVFRGRVDDQVKIRGVRIELAEIDVCLSNMLAVDSARAFVRKVNNTDMLVGYIKLRSQYHDNDAHNILEEIKYYAGKELSEHMTPVAFVLVDSWPITANGKIDVSALPIPKMTSNDYVVPSSDCEREIAQIWSELLGLPVEKISARANFFDLGGHSLLCVRMLSTLRARMDVDLSVKEIFENPRLEDLANCIKRDQIITNVALPNALVKDGDVVPLSFAQQRLWFINKLQGSSSEYNISLVFDVEGEFDLNAATKAFQHIILRHKVLHSNYIERDGEAFQYIRPFEKSAFSITIHDLQEKCDIDELLSGLCSKPFDLSKDLMLRVSYIKRSSASGTLVLNMHHIASDGWSMQILKNEFVTIYSQLSTGNTSPLQSLNIQYADYALWLRTQLESGQLDDQFEYWQKQLESAPPLHSLPLDYKRPDFKGNRGAVVHGVLSQAVNEKLACLASDNQLTPFMLLHGALSLLLARHSNEQHIVIGTPVANRALLEVESLIGFFVNTLVLKVDTQHATVSEYFEHVRAVNIDAQANQDATVDRLVERLNVPRSNAYSPLFQIVMALNSDFGGNIGDNSEQVLRGVEITPRNTSTIQSKFDLEVDFNINKNGITVAWTYDVELFSKAHIELLNKHLCQLLEQLSCANSDDSLTSLSLLSGSESHALLSHIHHTRVPYEKSKCIHHWFEEIVTLYPHSTALICDESSLTYAQLNEQADRLAVYLVHECDIQPSSFVGLSAHPSLELIVGLLAILKAGAAYIPIDPSYPTERVEFILQDAETNVVLCQDKYEKNLKGFQGSIIAIEEGIALGKELKSLHVYASMDAVTSDQLAYVIYTSGSTGTPKGVLIEHRSVINLITSQLHNYQIEPNNAEVGLLLSTYAFDASVEQIFTMLLSANSVVLPKKQAIVDPRLLESVIERHKVTHVDSTPSHLMSICDVLNASSIKRIVSGGEAMLSSLLTHVEVDIFNVYGPTEACVTSSIALNSESLGTPLNNTQYYVLDKQLQFTPPNGIGELFIGGDGLARGYLNRPELTKKHFIDNPFYSHNIEGSSERLYRTGDLVRYLPNGNLLFVGRMDDQVKIRGFRIELGELENKINSIDIVDSAVVMTSVIAGTEQLVCYVKAVSGFESVSEVEFTGHIKRKLNKQLPAYMVPQIYIVIKEWPLTINGKINKRLLPEPKPCMDGVDHLSASSETEVQLRAIWADVLGLQPEAIGVNLSFFDLGGHSLLAVKLLSAIQSRLCPFMELATLFNYKTIMEQAEFILSSEQQRQCSLIHKVTAFDSHSPALIFIPGVASTARDFEQIIEKLNTHNYEIGILKHKGLLKGDAFFDTIHEAAIAYGDLLLSMHLKKIKLIGHSFGGTLALEVARYLRQHNCKVDIVLLDTYFSANSFFDKKKHEQLDKKMTSYDDIPEHLVALYQHQSQLFDDYIPLKSTDCNVSLVIANDSPIPLSTYQQYLDNTLMFEYENIISVKGDHMGMLQGEGANKIVNLITSSY